MVVRALRALSLTNNPDTQDCDTTTLTPGREICVKSRKQAGYQPVGREERGDNHRHRRTSRTSQKNLNA